MGKLVEANSVRRQRGVGLIEVLIAVVILSIGFLAVAKMQIAGMRNSQNAYFLSQANFMLRDMTDRMRANRDGVIANHYDNFVTNGSTSEPACFSSGNQCNIAEIAQADLHAWSLYLHAPVGAVDFKPLLPQHDTVTARGEIQHNAATNVYTLSVSWGEQHNGTIEEQTLSVLLMP